MLSLHICDDIIIQVRVHAWTCGKLTFDLFLYLIVLSNRVSH